MKGAEIAWAGTSSIIASPALSRGTALAELAGVVFQRTGARHPVCDRQPS